MLKGLDEGENCIVCSALRENCHLCIKGHQLFYLFREWMESQQGNDKNLASLMRGCVRKIRIVALDTVLIKILFPLLFPKMELEEKSKQQNEVLEKTRNEVNEVIDTMTKTAEVLQERSDKLGMTSAELQKLEEGAHLLQKNASALADKMWWENTKFKVALGVMVGVVVIVIIVIIILESLESKS